MDIHSDHGAFNMRKRPLIFLDLEATGLEVQKHEIIEIGALKVDPKKPFKILDELSIKVKPQNLAIADPVALKKVQYNEEEWKEAVSLEDALSQLDAFVGKDGVLVGFNINFDWAMLDRAYFSLGKKDPFYYHRLDVASMAYFALFGKSSLMRFSLSEIAKYLKIKREISHRALDDAKVTYLVFKQLFNYTKNI